MIDSKQFLQLPGNHPAHEGSVSRNLQNQVKSSRSHQVASRQSSARPMSKNHASNEDLAPQNIQHRDSSLESLHSTDSKSQAQRKIARRVAKERKKEPQMAMVFRGSSDWMSTVGAGIEPNVYQTHLQANRQAKLNEAKFRQTLTSFEKKREDQATQDILEKAKKESRQAMMPQVRIRNISKEYKIAAGVFSPELLALEENWGKAEPIDVYQQQQQQNTTATKSKTEAKARSMLKMPRHQRPSSGRSKSGISKVGEASHLRDQASKTTMLLHQVKGPNFQRKTEARTQLTTINKEGDYDSPASPDRKTPFKKRHKSINEQVVPLNLFGRPTYTKNQAAAQKNLESFAEKISCLDTLEKCEDTVYRLVPNLPNGKTNRQGTTGMHSPTSRGSNSVSPTRWAFAGGETMNSSHSIHQQTFTSAMSTSNQKSASQGFRVVKPFSSSQSRFYQTGSSSQMDGFGSFKYDGYAKQGPYQSSNAIPQKPSTSRGELTDRNNRKASKSSLSKQRHGQAQLFLRELQVALKRDQDVTQKHRDTQQMPTLHKPLLQQPQPTQPSTSTATHTKHQKTNSMPNGNRFGHEQSFKSACSYNGQTIKQRKAQQPNEESAISQMSQTFDVNQAIQIQTGGYQRIHKSLKQRKPKTSQDQIFFNSLKDMFRTKDAFLRFNQIKKHNTESVTRAQLIPLLGKIDAYEGRISQRNVFEARKGLCAVFNQTMGSVFMFGGIGLKVVKTVENFCEDTFEFAKMGDARASRSYLARMPHLNSTGAKTALKKSSHMNSQRGSVSLNFSEQPVVNPSNAPADQPSTGLNKDFGRFYHLMVPYKHYLCIYGGQSVAGGLASRAYRSVHCEIFLYDLITNKWEEIVPKNLNRVEASRRNHCGAILGEWLIVYGGLNTCVNYLDDLQAFNFQTLQWKKLQSLGKRKPPALARSAMQVVFHRQREEQYIRDFGSIPEPEWAKVDQDLRVEGVYMYGGQCANGEASGNLYILRALKKGLTWTDGATLCEGQSPEARFDHKMSRLRENLVVMGGRNRTAFVKSIYLLDLCKLVWTKIALSDSEDPSAKLSLERAEFSCAGSRHEDKIYIFGGIDSNFVLTNEVLVLKFDQLQVNPLLEEQFKYTRFNQQQDKGVDLQFFNMQGDDDSWVTSSRMMAHARKPSIKIRKAE